MGQIISSPLDARATPNPPLKDRLASRGPRPSGPARVAALAEAADEVAGRGDRQRRRRAIA